MEMNMDGDGDIWILIITLCVGICIGFIFMGFVSNDKIDVVKADNDILIEYIETLEKYNTTNLRTVELNKYEITTVWLNTERIRNEMVEEEEE